jgi:hypothetical protein
MGGAAGHMAHLHEDLSLTFNELISIIDTVASADIEVTEKVDGQNLFLTVNELGEIRTARNPTDIRKGGMTPEEYTEKWQGHPAENAFMRGFKAVKSVIDSLPIDQQIEIFDAGRSYVNMEIMYYNPDTGANSNIINYNACYIVMHALVSDDPNSEEQFQRLSSLVNAKQAEVDDQVWSIYGPQIIELNDIANGEAHETAKRRIAAIAQPVGMNATIESLCKIYYKDLMISDGIPENICDEIIKLVFKEPGAASLREIKKMSPGIAQKISKYSTKVNSKKIISAVLRPLENIINDFAIEVLRGLRSFFAVDHDQAMSDMKQELETSIIRLRELAAEGDENMGAMVDRQLAKLGNVENLASSLEGIVFRHNGKVYKMTGAFAMANQIIGRARRAPKKETLSEELIRKMVRESISRTYLSMLPRFR